MAFNLTRLLLLHSTTVFRNRSYHSLITIRKNLIKQIKCSDYRYLCSPSSMNTSPENVVENVNNPETDEFDGEESPYTNVDFAVITSNNPKKIRDLKIIQLEVDMMRQQGEKVPNKITEEQWIELLDLDSARDRIKHYNYLWLNETKRLHAKVKRARIREEYLERKAEQPEVEPTITTSGPIIYALQYNTLFFRLYDNRLNRFFNLRLFYASMFGSHIVVDCSYEPFMVLRNINLCVKQMLLMWSENRDQVNPCHLTFCNLKKDSVTFEKLYKVFPLIEEPDFPFFYTSEDYLDLYPKNRLVYLTPHCSEELLNYNHEDIYIIGGFVDLHKSEPLSLAKAKKEGIRMAKFPLDRYLKWQIGTKSLTLNHSLAIMNDLKDTNDWNYALKHIPARKIRCRDSPFECNDEKLDKMSNRVSAKGIREHYRRNLVYDLLMKETSDKEKNSPAD